MCKDGSCSGGIGAACYGATIPYVVASCTGGGSCNSARIGSAVSSCKERGSCFDTQLRSAYKSCNDKFSCQSAQLSGVDLINSCNKDLSCLQTNGNGEDFELTDCCNGYEQCTFEEGADAFYAAGCVSYCVYYTPAFDCLFI